MFWFGPTDLESHILITVLNQRHFLNLTQRLISLIWTQTNSKCYSVLHCGISPFSTTAGHHDTAAWEERQPWNIREETTPTKVCTEMGLKWDHRLLLLAISVSNSVKIHRNWDKCVFLCFRSVSDRKLLQWYSGYLYRESKNWSFSNTLGIR